MCCQMCGGSSFLRKYIGTEEIIYGCLACNPIEGETNLTEWVRKEMRLMFETNTSYFHMKKIAFDPIGRVAIFDININLNLYYESFLKNAIENRWGMDIWED